MDGEAGHPTPDLARLRQNLGKNASEYQFVQAVRLLRLLLEKEPQGDPQEDFWHRIMIRPTLSLAFPPNDIDSLTWEGWAGKPVLDVNFFGLYGVASPLPTFYTEDLIEEKNEDGSAARDFLDILHGRLYPLLYEVWEKNRLSFRAYEKGEQEIENLLHVFTGFSLPVFRNVDPLAPSSLRYAGLLTQHSRSARGLESILSDVLGGIPVRIDQCVERRVKIPEEQRLVLGGSLALGEETLLGSAIADRSNQIGIRIGPVDNGTFETLMPGQENLRKIAFWKEVYLLDPLMTVVEVRLSDSAPKPVILGEKSRNRLGLDAWLESGTFQPEKSVFIGVDREAALQH
jgi:type VI secretion system protein ImpH